MNEITSPFDGILVPGLIIFIIGLVMGFGIGFLQGVLAIKKMMRDTLDRVMPPEEVTKEDQEKVVQLIDKNIKELKEDE